METFFGFTDYIINKIALTAFGNFLLVGGVPIIGITLAILGRRLKIMPKECVKYKKYRIAYLVLYILFVLNIIYNFLFLCYGMRNIGQD